MPLCLSHWALGFRVSVLVGCTVRLACLSLFVMGSQLENIKAQKNQNWCQCSPGQQSNHYAKFQLRRSKFRRTAAQCRHGHGADSFLLQLAVKDLADPGYTGHPVQLTKGHRMCCAMHFVFFTTGILHS